ncbi:CD92 [Mytilus edulis]|uniref:Choline transporter-like protein n=1 Tax=Mytilus edulis TaxID=6550 RepID=A0A8S3SC73_MYTED|nr:CD92 [Mytilus edulis]
MIIILLILLIMRKRIGLVVELFKEAGKAIKDMPLLIFQPIWTFVCLVLELVCLVFFFSYILTSEHPVVNNSTGFVSFEKHEILKYLKWYYLLGSIWILQFTLACDTIVISGAVSQWYFSRDKSLVRYPIIRSLRMLLRYHLGSAAFGSLIITIVFAFRVFVNFIHNRLKNKTGSIVEFFLKCFGCCLWCFEKFISFLNSNAYVEIAITGYGFCHSARRAFKIVVGNALRLAAINSVGSFTLFLGKLAPLSVVIVLGLKLLANRGDIFYPWFPITISCIAAFIIASCFMGIYEKCIDTIFICFCEDHELNDGELKPYFMSLGLMILKRSENKSCKFEFNISKHFKHNASRLFVKDTIFLLHPFCCEDKTVFLARLEKNLSSLSKHSTLIFQTVLTNVGDGYNPSNGVFTSKRKGAYFFSWTSLTKTETYFKQYSTEW